MNKKDLKIAAIIFSAMIGLTACSKTPQDTISNSVNTTISNSKTSKLSLIENKTEIGEDGFYKGITASDYVTLPENYMDLTVNYSDVAADSYSLADKMIYLQNTLGRSVTVTDRAAQVGDHVVVNYIGRVDGKEFVGGSAENYYATLGMSDIAFDLDDSIVGHKVGDTFTATGRLSSSREDSTDLDGNDIELAGKECEFEITLKAIETIELQDADVAQYFEGIDTLEDGTKIETVDQAALYYKESMEKQNEKNYVYNYLMENSEISQIPSSVLGYLYDNQLKNIQTQVDNSEYESLDDYLVNYGYADKEEYLDSCEDSVFSSAKRTSIYQAIAEKEGITISENEFGKYFGGDATTVIEAYGKPAVAQIALGNKVVEEIVNRMTIDTSEETSESEETEAGSNAMSSVVSSSLQK